MHQNAEFDPWLYSIINKNTKMMVTSDHEKYLRDAKTMSVLGITDWMDHNVHYSRSIAELPQFIRSEFEFPLEKYFQIRL